MNLTRLPDQPVSLSDVAEVCAVLRRRSLSVDREAAFSFENWALLSRAGLTGILVPREFGGAGADLADLVSVIRAVGGACPSTGLALVMHNCAAAVISAMAAPAIRAVYLPRIASGGLIAAYAGTERTTGTNFWALESCAAKTGEGYRLNLRKSWATLAEVADLFVIPTRDHAAADWTDVSLFLVERAEGVTSPEPWRGSGMRGSSSGPVNVDAVVPEDRLIGPPCHANEYITTDMFNLLLLSHAALYLGIAEEALSLAANHAALRRFPHTGESLADTSLWQNRIGELSSGIQAGRALVASSAGEATSREAQDRVLKSALAAKITGCGLARRATEEALQISGGSGYNTGQRVEMLWRDARAGSLMRPSDEVAGMILGRLECGLPAFNF